MDSVTPRSVLCSQVLALKIPLDQAIGRVTDRNRIGLQPVLGFWRQCSASSPSAKLLLTPCSPIAPMTTNPVCIPSRTASWIPLCLPQTCIQVSHGIENTQARTYRSLGIIFMGLGIAKVHEESIPEELGDVSIIALNHLRTHPLIRTDHIPVLFGVELR